MQHITPSFAVALPTPVPLPLHRYAKHVVYHRDPSHTPCGAPGVDLLPALRAVQQGDYEHEDVHLLHRVEHDLEPVVKDLEHRLALRPIRIQLVEDDGVDREGIQEFHMLFETGQSFLLRCCSSTDAPASSALRTERLLQAWLSSTGLRLPFARPVEASFERRDEQGTHEEGKEGTMWTLYESHPKGSRQDWDKLEERQKAALLTHLTQTLAAVHKLTPPASLVAHLQFSAPTRSAWAESPTMTKSDLAELIFTKLGLRSPPTAAMSTTSTAENGTASASATTTNDHDQPGTDISTEPARGRARLRAAGGAETGSAIPNSADVASDTDTDTAPDPVSDAKASPIPVPVPVQFKTTKNEGRGTSADSGVAGMSLSPETDKTLAVSSGGGEGQGTLAANLSSAVGSPPECDGGARAVGGPGMDGLGVPMRARRTSVAEKNEARIRALLEAVPDEREEPCLYRLVLDLGHLTSHSCLISPYGVLLSLRPFSTPSSCARVRVVPALLSAASITLSPIPAPSPISTSVSSPSAAAEEGKSVNAHAYAYAYALALDRGDGRGAEDARRLHMGEHARAARERHLVRQAFEQTMATICPEYLRAMQAGAAVRALLG